jgi:hypothetical protein
MQTKVPLGQLFSGSRYSHTAASMAGRSIQFRSSYVVGFIVAYYGRSIAALDKRKRTYFALLVAILIGVIGHGVWIGTESRTRSKNSAVKR